MSTTPATRYADRVRHAGGRTGTVVDLHAGALGVLPDVGPRALQLWHRSDVERIAGPARTCHRCRAKDHNALTCTAGDQPGSVTTT